LFGRKLRNPLLYLLAPLALVLPAAGCGQSEDLPPDQVIQKAAPAMQAVSSFHFLLETSKPQKPLPGLFINRVEGDVVKPDKLLGDVQATYAGLAINAKVVVDGKSQYMTDPVNGKWSSMSTALNVMQFFDPAKGISDILANVKELKGDGKENLDGVDTYRLRGTVQAAVLKSLSPEVAATGDLPATLWVGSSDFLLRRVRLEGALVGTEPASTVRTLSFKDYDKPVKIETPVVEK
jgi:lipoprotein LprG